MGLTSPQVRGHSLKQNMPLCQEEQNQAGIWRQYQQKEVPEKYQNGDPAVQPQGAMSQEERQFKEGNKYKSVLYALGTEEYFFRGSMEATEANLRDVMQWV